MSPASRQFDAWQITFQAKEAGFLYIYVSNDNPTPVEVYFDDFKVEQTKSPVVQQDDYYPLGLAFNSYSRENGVKQNYLYNGKELQDALNLGWLDYGARMYIPQIGRWKVNDPLAAKYVQWSTYNYALIAPVVFVDPDGREIMAVNGGVRFTGADAQIAFRAIQGKFGSSKGIHFVLQSKTPNIYRHTLNAFRAGKPAVLHYDSDKKGKLPGGMQPQSISHFSIQRFGKG